MATAANHRLQTPATLNDGAAMWKGRFQVDPSNLVQRYGESISFDWRLYPYDVEGSIAHATALKAAGIITARELASISRGLRNIREDISAGKFAFDTALEDIHMNIESALTKRIGDAGAKLHTARSRNDQIALDVRLYCRDETKNILELLLEMQRTLVKVAADQGDAVIPGYTHLQRGQPVLFAHHLLAYVEMLERDIGAPPRRLQTHQCDATRLRRFSRLHDLVLNRNLDGRESWVFQLISSEQYGCCQRSRLHRRAAL